VQEIILADDVKPYLEWVNNRILPKVSPDRRHALAQRRFAAALGNWADDLRVGEVGTEWRFQVKPAGEIRRSLIPDVAYVSYRRIALEELDQTLAPAISPDVVVEIRSPDDRQEDIDEKVRVYLAAGTSAVFLVDPRDRSVLVVDDAGERDLSAGPIVHDALPGFSLDPSRLFDFSKMRG